jgi:hypothetical protein
MIKITLKNSIIALFFILFIFGFFFESIPVYDGLGWDGSTYYNIATSGLSQFTEFKISGYYVFRSLPFVLFNFLPFENSINIFLIYMNVINFIAIMLSVLYFFRIMKQLNVDEKMSIVCFILLFFNFPILKLVSYNPALTDHLSFFLSIVGFYYFLIKNKLASTIIIFISLFTFPSLSIVLLILNLFNVSKRIDISSFWSKVLNILFPILLLTFVILMINSVYESTLISKTTRQLLPLSVLLLTLYLSYIAYVFVKSEKFLSLPSLYFSILIIIIFFIFLIILKAYPSPPKTSYFSIIGFGYSALKYPASFLVYHTFYFGLLFLFVIINFRKLLRNTVKIGTGPLIVSLFFMLFLLQSESRIFINIIPIILFILFSNFKSNNIPNYKIWLLLLIGILFSRIFYKINNVPNMWDLMRNESIRNEFPVQGYFMNFGPWISYEIYCIQSIIFIMAFIIIFSLFRSILLPLKKYG